ncbi:MAG TPA: NTP transferase domain-containing protein [Gaiellaceae bacterium]|jgi:bifunctional UDP-N-acetylglucosamine pyrophosphorylase/glucosamine-1-phosphate N-acetyltransferase
MTSSLAAVVMAAGLGTRMRSERPKHLHPLLGRRLIDWSIEPVLPLQPDPLVVVCSPATEDELSGTLPPGAALAVQEKPRGTGDAVEAARSALEGFAGDVFVLDGAAPLLTTELLEALLAEHRSSGAAVTVLSIEPDEPLPYGRIIRDASGALRAIVEDKDATPEERAIRELNTSIYVFRAVELWPALEALDPANAQGELYLTDAVRSLVDTGHGAAVYCAPVADMGLGVNTRAELAEAAAELRRRIVVKHLAAGVAVVDPSTTWIEPAVVIEPEALIQPFTILRGRTVIGAGAEVGPHALVVDSEVGAGDVVAPFTYRRPEGEGS